jgi:hypothetical protein
MKPSKLPLTLAATLFIGWISYLAYLALTSTHPTILSRPQFLLSRHDVVALVEEQDDGQPASLITVEEVLWSERDKTALTGAKIEVQNLPQLTRAEGWQGARRYILPLIERGPDVYAIAPTPRSPGFDPKDWPHGTFRIYPDTDEIRKQLDQLRKPQAAPPPDE